MRSWTGFKHTPETCNIIREKALMRGARSDATKKKLSDVKGQYFEIYHEVEGLITGVNLKTFEKNRGLSRGSLGHVISGNTIRCKGFFKDKETCENWWKAKQLREEEKIKKKSKPRKPPSQHRQKEFSLYKVGTGTIYATNVRAFARENELDYRALYKILDGRAIEHKGYYKDEESYFKSISKILNQASVHKGVTFNKNENKWRTTVYLPEIKKQIFVGQYRTEQEAANAAYEARIFYGLEIS